MLDINLLMMFILYFVFLQEPNNLFTFHETAASQYVEIDPNGVLRVKAELDNAPNTFLVRLSLLC